MESETDAVVIVGASVAGVATARALRAEGFVGAITIVGAERDWPYDKPPLSKQILTGEWTSERIELITRADAAALNFQVRLGVPATHLDVVKREIELGDGSLLAYDVCVIATGLAARPSPWPSRPGVHVLRSLGDALVIRERLAECSSLAIVGGGFIGAEVASAARTLGLQVTVIDSLPRPMERVVGPEAADLFTELAVRSGVDLRCGVGVEGIDGGAGALRLTLTDGSLVEAELVVVGIGAIPNDGWLLGSGLPIDNGIVCDAHCQVNGAQAVYAAGDIARWTDSASGETHRVEHWTNAVEQAACVARNIVHPANPCTYAAVPYVWTDQYGWKLQIVGSPVSGVRHAICGDLDAERPRAAMLYSDRESRLVGAVTVNWPNGLATCRRALRDSASFERVLTELNSQVHYSVTR